MLKRIIKEGKLKLRWNYKRELIKKHKLTYLFWECTSNCNFNCAHCGSSLGKWQVFNNDLTTDEIKSVFKDISENFDISKITVAVTGWEPLMRKDLFDVMTYANKLGFNRWFVSNGSLINENIIEKLRETGIFTAVISIDGPKEIHDKFRWITWSYDKAIHAIKLLKTSKMLKVLEIITTIHQWNIDYLEDMYNAFIALWIDSRRLNDVDPIWRAEQDKNLMLNENQTKKLFNFIKEKRKKDKRVTTSCSWFFWPEFEWEIRNWFFKCSAGINIWSILSNWDIFVCPNVPRRKELIQWNVKNHKFSEVWNNWFKVFRNENRTHCEDCNNCDYWKECMWWSFHLRDFDKNNTKKCHYKIVNEHNSG